MFSNTPPAGSRLRRGGAAGRRQSSKIPPPSADGGDLPYVSPMANYSYGSRVSNLPRVPRLSETRVPLSVQLQEKQDEAEARMRAAEEQRLREEASRRDRVSMPPPVVIPSRSPSRAPSVAREREPSRAPSVPRESREPSEPSEPAEPADLAEDVGGVSDIGINGIDNLSALSGSMNMNQSFRGLFGANQVVSSKVTENVNFEPDDDSDDGFPPPEIGLSEAPRVNGKKSSSRSKNSRNSALQPLESSSTSLNGTARETRSSARQRRSTTANTNDLDKDAPRSPGASRRRGQLDEGNKENDIIVDEIKVEDIPRPAVRTNHIPRRSSRPEDPRRTAISVEPVIQREEPPLLDDLDSEPGLWEQPLDWLFWQWNECGGWRLQWIVKVVLLVTISFVFYHVVRQHQPGIDFPGLVGWPRRSFTYKPPSAPPKDIEELADRLHGFEKALGRVDQTFAGKLEKEVVILNNAIKDLGSKITATTTKSAADAAASAQRLDELKKRLDITEKRAAEYKEIVNPENIISIQRRLEQLSPDRLRLEIRSQFRKALPASLVAHVTEDGSIDFMPDFKKALGEFFEDYLPNALTRHSPKIVTPGASKGVPSWETFMKANEKRLLSTIDSRVDSRVNPRIDAAIKPVQEAVLSKDTVLMMIQDRIGDFIDRYESQLTEQSGKFARLSATEQQQAATVAQMEAAVASLTARFNRLSSSQGVAPVASPRSSNGVIPAGSNVDLPDYANHLSGAYVYPYLTSPSYEPPNARPKGLFAYLLAPLVAPVRSSHPLAALLPSNDIGDCWTFPGRTGVLAIKLSHKIYPTHVTIEHGYKHFLPEISSAPKRISFWTLHPDEQESMEIERASLSAANIAHLIYPEERNIAGSSRHADDWNSFVKITDFSYDVDKNQVAQTWELPVDFQEMEVGVRVVAVKIEDNYGNEDFTTLYRVKVHGLKYEEDKSENSQKKTGWFGRS
ncbi:hypothetical protein EX30DRAFT_115653 [Ascodesmis nigricans]|uniref:SUN domain-containing protein n=1 Tax=Ascodesmis nigricans TaxID=341454 RepID=A0A4S2MQC6_9PEZI|nr:hypothetical protein EX30DRAFT_115653 [Ascodesmis nigricans]